MSNNSNPVGAFLKGHLALVVISAVFLLGLVLVATFIGASNRYNALVVRAEAKQTDNTNVFDNFRKKVRDISGVGDKEIAALESIITGNAEARSGNGGGSMFTMVTESVPQITEIKTLNRLVDIVAASRADWANAQTELIEIKRQGDHMMSQFPDSLVLSILGKQPITIVVVTSAETKENFRTGEDNESWITPSNTNPIER
jgi:hypothetical protein